MGLVNYLITQSNVLAAVGNSDLNVIVNARDWIAAQVSPFFRLRKEAFQFCGSVTIWKRLMSSEFAIGIRSR